MADYPAVSVRLAPSMPWWVARTSDNFYTRDEEVANWITHGIGVVLSGVAGVALLSAAVARGDGWHLTSFAIFAVALIGMYAASTLYHASTDERWRRVFRRLDYAAIFLLIAGTYTPFLLTKLRGPWGWSLFLAVWLVCGVGALSELIRGGRHRIGTTVTYLAAGWSILLMAKPMLTEVPSPSLWLLLAGGACYTGGVGFYLWERLRYHHAIWHLFVLAGSGCHCVSIARLLAPA